MIEITAMMIIESMVIPKKMSARKSVKEIIRSNVYKKSKHKVIKREKEKNEKVKKRKLYKDNGFNHYKTKKKSKSNHKKDI